MGVKVEKGDRVATVIIDVPPVNAITLADYAEIGAVFTDCGTWQGINCIVFTGVGERAFCAGLDLNEFVSAKLEDDPGRAKIVRACFQALRNAPVPVIAAVNGPALGAGAVLASCADIRIAASHATFGTPEINVGRCGGASHMMRHFPQGILRRMYFTGTSIDAEEAYRFGFVQEVVEMDRLMETAMALAEEIASKAPIGLRMAKEALNKVEFLETEVGYQLEQSYSTSLMTTDDAREAVRAVVEKRKPEWTGT